MGLNLRGWISVLTFVAASSHASVVVAQEPETSQLSVTKTLPELYDQFFRGKAGSYFKSRSLGDQLNLILGFEGFPENRLRRDFKKLGQFHKNALEQQSMSDPIIRTPDLANPFDESLLTLSDQEPVREPVPEVIIIEEQQPEPLPPAPPVVPPAPVPALW